MRYFIGINSSTENNIYFENKEVLEIESNSPSIFHESIIIDNNKEVNIFSMNYQYFDFINIKDKIITSNKTDNLIINNNGAEVSFRNSIIKLKNNNYYLLSICLITGSLIKAHNIFYIIFSFASHDIIGYKEIEKNEKITSTINSTNCFQTESEYIQCSFTNVLPSNFFHVGIYDLNLNEINTISFNYIPDNSFTKIFHIKGEIGAYFYFDERDNNLPKLHIKELNEQKINLLNVFNFEYIELNGKGTYSLNTETFCSDAIKINNTKFVVTMTSQNLKNLLICICDLYFDEKYIRLRYFYLDLEISVNIRAFKLNNYFGILFYNPNIEYPGYLLFNYFNVTNQNKINNTFIEIKLFTDSTSFVFSFSENFEFVNNLFEGNEKIKIINFVNKSSSGVILQSSLLNSEISINDELNLNDNILFMPDINGAVPGEYILELVPIVNKIENKYFENLLEFYGDYENYINNNENIEIFNNDIYKIIYIVEFNEKCKTCNQLGNDSFNYCELCPEEFPYIIINGKKCEDKCNNYIYINVLFVVKLKNK